MSPRRRDGELGAALNTDRLLDDLLRAAEAGNLPLASVEEHWAWVHAWGRQHPGHYAADSSPRTDWSSAPPGQRWVWGPFPSFEDMPLGVARRDAISYCEVILPLFPGVKRSQAEELARQAWVRAHPKPPADADSHGRLNAAQWAWQRELAASLAGHREAFDEIEEQAQAECAATRAEVVRRFKLEGLVRVAPARSPAQGESLEDRDPPRSAADREPGAKEETP